jgi:LuxR family maltose regulon positive regulatory protein
VTTPTPDQTSEEIRRSSAGRVPRPPLTLVTRQRLHSALDLGARAPLTMLVAPAGTGKTVLLSDWVARRRQAGESVVWVSGQAPGALADTLDEAAGGDGTRPPDPVVVDDAHLPTCPIC